jgi:four helix bundle protein
MHDYHNIDAWRRAHALSIAIDRTTRLFARRGYAYLRTQLAKASDSIPHNIVEGAVADTKKEFARFLTISIRSANETESRLLTARDLSLVSPDEWAQLSAETVEVRKMIFGYRKKILLEVAEEEARKEKGRRGRPADND